MEREIRFTTGEATCKRDPWDRPPGGTVAECDPDRNPEWSLPWVQTTSPIGLPDSAVLFASEMSAEPETDQLNQRSHSSFTLGDFVEHRFIPEYVASKRSPGRSYFRTILNHVLTPERVTQAFAAVSETSTNKLKAIPGWPYMGSLRLCDISTETIQHLTTAALKHGYSAQTATHIRNVIRVIFSYAIRTGCHTGTNPASLVLAPEMVRKELHALSLAQLTMVIRAMRHPEKEFALFEILTDISVAELCGLQWKYLNLSSLSELVEGELIPSKTIAVRKLSYRGEFGDVTPGRERLMRVPDALCSILRDSKNRKRFRAPDDFVFASRNGTPIHAENIVARRLKRLGESLGMPWLSWLVFHRTGINLKAEFGRRLPEEVEKILSPEKPTIHPLR